MEVEAVLLRDLVAGRLGPEPLRLDVEPAVLELGIDAGGPHHAGTVGGAVLRAPLAEGRPRACRWPPARGARRGRTAS